jgi:hypothetical protein
LPCKCDHDYKTRCICRNKRCEKCYIQGTFRSPLTFIAWLVMWIVILGAVSLWTAPLFCLDCSLPRNMAKFQCLN